MKARTDAHDNVALRDEETITWWAMMHNMDDDRVPCNINVDDPCQQESAWAWHCSCGDPYLACTEHRQELDVDNKECELVCMKCTSLLPHPVPWLPM